MFAVVCVRLRKFAEDAFHLVMLSLWLILVFSRDHLSIPIKLKFLIELIN